MSTLYSSQSAFTYALPLLVGFPKKVECRHVFIRLALHCTRLPAIQEALHSFLLLVLILPVSLCLDKPGASPYAEVNLFGQNESSLPADLKSAC